MDVVSAILTFIYNPFGVVNDAARGWLLAIGVPDWLVAAVLTSIGIGMVLGVISIMVMIQIWAERKVIARVQDRYGPNRVGPYGLLQSVADAIKLLLKEDIVPWGAEKVVFTLAPLLVLVPSLLIYAVLPFGPGLEVTNLDIGLLAYLALSAVPTIGIIMAGWASNNKYSLLGGMRAAAQLISYEIPLTLAVLPAVMFAGTLSLSGIVQAQSPLPFILWIPVGPIAFLLYIIAGLAEVNRSPFDLPEAESEIIAGFHTEYSGMRFALFFLAEYANAFTVSAIAATLFLGGWKGPILPPWIWFFIKVWAVFFIMLWVRATLPRLRYDQLMRFAWKGLLPLSLANLVVAAFMAAIFRGGTA